MAACRRGTGCGPSCFRPPSNSRSPSSGARFRRSPTIGAAPTFDNTIAALDAAGRRLGRVGTVFGVMNLNMSTPAYQALQREWGPRLVGGAGRDPAQRPALPAHPRGLRGARAVRPDSGPAAADASRPTSSSCSAAPISTTRRSSSFPPTISSWRGCSPISARSCSRTNRPISSRPRPSWPACPRTSATRPPRRRASATCRPASSRSSTPARRSIRS